MAAGLAAFAAATTAVLLDVGLATHSRALSDSKTAAPRRRARAAALPGPIPGYLLIADRGNDRMLLVDSRKRIVWRYPKSGASVPMPFRFDDDTFFGPNRDRIISNQEDQHTIQIISFPGGRVLWRYGHVNAKGAKRGYLNTPDDAYLLPNGLVTVADAYNCRVLFIASNHRIVRRYGAASACRHDPPRTFGAINGATPLPDGGTLVSEINGSWVDDIGPDGRLRWSARAPVSYPSDPQPYGKGRILIAVNDDYRDRVVIVSTHTDRIVWQYGHTDVPGTGPGYLNTPDGLDLLPAADVAARPALRALLTRR